ncbi:MAG TPA: hypothetical protein VK626_01435 [Nitrospiraceae bacterium]|nr:hypothetical protein [Nitrospiraceae bacterium]
MAAVQEQADQDGGRLSRESRYGRGVFFPLTHLRARDPEATAVIYPSDHVVHLEVKFIEELRHAAWTAERYEAGGARRPTGSLKIGLVGSNRAQNSVRSEGVRYEGHCRHKAFPAISDERRLPTLP